MPRSLVDIAAGADPDARTTQAQPLSCRPCPIWTRCNPARRWCRRRRAIGRPALRLVATSGIVGAAPALRLCWTRGGPVDPEAHATRRPCAKRRAPTTPRSTGCPCSIRREPEGRRQRAATLLGYDLLRVCGAGRGRWTVASTSSSPGWVPRAPKYDPGQSEPTDAGWRDAGDTCCHPRRRRAQPSTVPGRRPSSPSSSNRVRVLSSRQRRLDGGRRAARTRGGYTVTPGRRDEAVESGRGIPRDVARAHRAEHEHCGSNRHDQLRVARSGGGPAFRRHAATECRRRSGRSGGRRRTGIGRYWRIRPRN